MGAIPPQVKKDRPGCNPGDQRQLQSLLKERINMEIVSPSRRVPTSHLAVHFLQVYRPLDTEKLKSQASEESETLQLCGCVPIDGVSTPHLFHDKHSGNDEPVNREGK
jgi:hypothetical protein